MSNKWMLKLDSEDYSWLRRAVIIGGFCHALTVPPPVTLRVLLGFNWRTLRLYPRVPPITANEDNKLSREIKKEIDLSDFYIPRETAYKIKK